MGRKIGSPRERGRTQLVSMEQTMQVVAAFGEIGESDAKWAPAEVHALLLQFQTARLIDDRFPNLGEHRERLRKIYNASFELSSILSEEIGLTHLMLGHDYVSQYLMQESQAANEAFRGFLKSIMINSTAALTDDQILADMRHDRKPSQGKKSLERRNLWEPLFELWLSCHGNARFSAGGPLEKMIVAAHEVVGLPPPNFNTLKRALISWRKAQGMQAT